jgi:stage II sporulation protein D
VRVEGVAVVDPGPEPGAFAALLAGALLFRAAEGGVTAEGAALPAAAAVRMRAAEGASFRIGSRRYPGTLEVAREGEGLRVVDETGLETYLEGVVGFEMPASWEAEALKAQAVAARTYAAARRSDARAAGAAFDLRDDTRSQVYGGRPEGAWAPRVREAVAATAGTVLAARGKPFTAYFHSTCGGHTESAERVFATDRGVGPLAGSPCGFCEGSPAYRWEARLAKADVEAALDVEGIESVQAEDPGPSGRCSEVRVETAGGPRLFPAMEFRKKIGYAVLKSTAFGAEVEGEEIRFRGTGFGHGVGMCQWGARGMARAGRTYREILLHYYPGADLVQARGSAGR